MLLELRVENLGIIAELLVPFGPGLTAITGETGAGKTLLVDALDLLCGGRADAAAVRDGAAEARVEGRFVVDDEELVLARVVPVVGRSRGYVNGRLATASELAEWGRELVDLHGQHAHQSLLHAPQQRALLDRYAGDDAIAARDRLRDVRRRMRQVDDALAASGGDERARAREVDLLRYQLGEIDDARVEAPDEDEQLAREEDVLGDAEAHRDALAAAYTALQGPAADALGDAVAQLAGRAPFETIAERLRALQAEVTEVAHDVRVAGDEVVADPERLAWVQDRRSRLRELTRKYGPTLADVVAYAGDAHTRLAELESHDARAAELDAERRKLDEAARSAADDLSRHRRAAAPVLAAAVTRHLRELAMPKATFEVDIRPAAPADDGADEVAFLLAANPGEPARPLGKAASGGELSRAMLAVRAVLSEAPPVLVFDEVDAGIGGETGTVVGRALARLAAQGAQHVHQVLCVTHLAQVAAFADAHVAVTKSEAGGRTVADATLLLDEARVAELARMLGGATRSAVAREHARELLTSAHPARRKARIR